MYWYSFTWKKKIYKIAATGTWIYQGNNVWCMTTEIFKFSSTLNSCREYWLSAEKFQFAKIFNIPKIEHH